MTTTTPAVDFVTTLKLTVGAADLDKSIASIKNRGEKLDADIQLTGLSCLHHLQLHGDIGFVNRLFLALPKGARKNAFAEWALAYGRLVINTGAGAKDMPFLYNKDKVTNLTDANLNAWYTFKPEPSLLEAFDLQAEVAKIIKRMQSEQKKNPNIQIKHSELLIGLVQIADGVGVTAAPAVETPAPTEV
jgi:hypothetical protein